MGERADAGLLLNGEPEARAGRKANWLTLGVSLAIGLALLEIAARRLSPPSPFTPLVPLRPHQRIELRTDLHGVSASGVNSTNRWGMRGDEPPTDWKDTYTIVTVGGSTTQCFFLDDHKTWPYLLQQKLDRPDRRVWVGNGGLDGNSSRAHVLFMQEVIAKIRPRAVLVLCGVNDLALSLSQDWFEFGSRYDKTSLGYMIFGSSRLVQILAAWKAVVFDHALVVDAKRPLTFQPKPLPANAAQLPADPASYLPQLSEYRENLKRIIALGREQDVRVIFITQPMLFDRRPEWKLVEGTPYFLQNARGVLSGADYWTLLDLYNQQMREVCREEGIECCDLASVMPHDFAWFYDAVHFNEPGAALVADSLARFLDGKGALR